VLTDGGDPPILPVWWRHPDDADLLAVDDELLVGPDVLVAPVFEAGATRRDVRLPPGTWFGLHDDEPHEGRFTAAVTIDRIPAFVRAGAVLPTDEAGRDVLRLFPPDPDEPASSTWYRDAGDGYGPGRTDRFEVAAEDDGWAVRRTVGEAGYEVDDGDLAVVLHGGPWTVSVDGGAPQATAGGQPVRTGDFAELVVRRPD
jgi:hypothetical protein